MPQVIETTVFKYDELADKAKEVARDWFRKASEGDDFWQESVMEDAERMGNMLGIEFKQTACQTIGGKTVYHPAIMYTGFWSQGDGACFEGSYTFKPDALAEVTEETGGTDKELISIAANLANANGDMAEPIACAVSHSGRYYHANSMSFDFDRMEEDGETELDSTTQEAVTDALRRFANWVYSNLQKEYEYQNADEQIAGNIRANEYTFTAAGKRFG